MKKKKVQIEKRKYDRGQIFVKVVAAILTVLMIVAVAASAIYALFI